MGMLIFKWYKNVIFYSKISNIRNLMDSDQNPVVKAYSSQEEK
jgi:hypothetical protein